MKACLFTPAAAADLDAIWDYTAEYWNADQADRYTDTLRDACHDLASGRRRGQRATVRQGYMKCRVALHFIYYREDASDLVVIRILHGKMDAERHLH